MRTDFQQLFPTATPESLGLPSAAVSNFVAHLSTLDQAHSFILIRHGKTLASGAWAPYQLDLPHELFSLSKSFVSSAIGIAQGEGLLSIHDKFIDFFPEYLSDAVTPAMRRLSLRDALRMNTGHDRCAFAFVDWEEGGWVKRFLESTLAWEPGERFVYNSAATFMLAAVIRKVTGQNVVEYLQPRLFEPLGIAAPQWDCNPDGVNIGGWGLWLSTMDIAKFAYLVLHGGNWNGRQLIPADYLKEATSFQSDNSMNGAIDWKQGYGYQFWRCQHGAIRGDGAAGQYAVIMPEQDMIFAFNSGLCNMQQVLDFLWADILPKLGPVHLPEDETAFAALQNELCNLSAKRPAELDSTLNFCTGTGDYSLTENRCGFKNLFFACDGDSCTLTIDGVTIPAGFGKLLFADVPLASDTPKRIASQAAWQSENRLFLYVFCIQTTARFTYELRFEDDWVCVHRTTPIYFNSDKGDVLFHGKRETPREK